MTEKERSRPRQKAATSSSNKQSQHIVADRVEALQRLRRNHSRTVPLECGCKWHCWCTFPPLTDHQLDGWAAAARHIIATTGQTPILPVEVLRAVWRRRGADRDLAEKLHSAMRSEAA